MPDLLVNLLKLPAVENAGVREFNVRRAQPFELTPVRRFVSENFSPNWADEISVGFARQPISVFIATIKREIVGFAGYECTRRGFFGPTGVASAARGKGIGAVLLLESLAALREMGYVYAHHWRRGSGSLLSEDGRCDYYSRQRTRHLYRYAQNRKAMNTAEAIPARKPQTNRGIPPGPKGSPIMGVMRDFNRDTLGFVERCRDYGDVVRTRFLWIHAYFLYNPDDIESLLTTNAKSYRKARSLRSPFFYRLVGNGLVTSEGDFWRRQRRLAQPAFHRQRISSYGDVMVDYALRAIDKWRPGEEIDISKDMTRLTLEIV